MIRFKDDPEQRRYNYKDSLEELEEDEYGSEEDIELNEDWSVLIIAEVLYKQIDEQADKQKDK